MKRTRSLSVFMVGLVVAGLLTWAMPAASEDTPGVWKLTGSMATSRRLSQNYPLPDRKNSCSGWNQYHRCGRRPPSGSWVAARSRIRWRARSGTRWTKPSRSWLESRKPRPRPMPDSYREAERDMLKVTMHWYAFQILTIRLVCSSGVWTWRWPNRPSQ